MSPIYAANLSVIRETKESVTRELVESHNSECSLDDEQAVGDCDEGVEAAGSRILTLKKSLSTLRGSPTQGQLATAMTDESSTNISATTTQGMIKKRIEADSEQSVSPTTKYDIPKKLSLPE